MKPNERKNGESSKVSAASLRAHGKIVDSLRTAVCNARDVLYDLAVAAMPFDPWGPGPSSIDELRSMTAKVCEWHAPLAAAYGWWGRHGERPNYNQGSLLYALMSYRTEEVSSHYELTPVRLTQFMGQPSEKMRLAMGDQARWLTSRRQHQSSVFTVLDWEEVRDLALHSKYLALKLVRWTSEAIDRMDSLMLPLITISEGTSRSHIARVHMAGVTRERKIQNWQLELLKDLAEMGSVDFKYQWRRSKLIDAIRELHGLIQTVDARTGKAEYRLDPRMKGRIRLA